MTLTAQQWGATKPTTIPRCVVGELVGRSVRMWGPRRLHRLLRASPEVHRRDAVYAANRAVRRAVFRRAELPPDVGDRVGVERHAGESTLLRAVVHQPVFTDVEV